MKKLLSLVLVCAMGLGMVSCVESEESPSVEAIRNAKAEQLKALANLANAQAEAAKITANAEAALKAAQTEYQKEMTKEAAEKFAVEIEVIKAQADSAILAAQKASAAYKNEILKMAHDQIAILYGQYEVYASKLNNANANLVKAKLELAKMENGLVEAVEVAETTIEEKTAEIAELEARLAVLTAPEASNAMNTDSLWAEVDKLTAAYNDAEYKYNMKEGKVAKEAKTAYETAKGEWDAKYDEEWDKYFNTYKVVDGNGDPVLDANGNEQWERNMWNVFETYSAWDVITNQKVIINEGNLKAWKDYVADNCYYSSEESINSAKEWLATVEAKATTAKKFHDELVPAVEAHDSAMVALALAWKEYDAVVTPDQYAADTLAAYRNLNGYADGGIVGALPQYKADTAALNALTKKKTEVETLEDKAAALAKAVTDAEKVVEAKKKVVTEAEAAAKKAADAVEAAKEAQAKIDQTAKPVEYAQAGVVVAQAETAKVAADAEVTKAKADVTKAEADVTKAEADVDAFVTKVKTDYGIILTGTATQKAEQIANALTNLKKDIYAAEIAVVKSTEALAEAQEAFAEAKAVSTDIKPAEEALVAAEAAARTAHKALEALLHQEEESEYYEWMKSTYGWSTINGEEIANFPHNYNTAIDIDPDENVVDNENVYGLLDLNDDKFADYEDDNTGLRLAKDVDFKVISDVDVQDLEAKMAEWNQQVLEAKQNVAREEHYFAVDSDFKREWKLNPETAEAALREFVKTLNTELDSAKELYTAWQEAKDAAEVAWEAVAAIKGEHKALIDLIESAYEGDYIIKDKISEIESLIEDAEEAIVDAEEFLNSIHNDENSYENTVAYKEAQIADKKATIAKLEAQIEHFSALLEHAKAELEAAVAAHVAE